MQKPPLQLKDHIFPKIIVVANNNEKIPEEIKKGKQFGYNYHFNVRCLRASNKSLEYQVELNIKTKSEDDKIQGYDVDITIAGLFDIEKEVKAKERDDVVSVLGPTLLFGAAREFLYNLTKRGPYPAIYLPTVSFMKPDKITEEAAPKKKSAKTKPKVSKNKAASTKK